MNAAAYYGDNRNLQVQTFVRLALLDISNAASPIRSIEEEVAAPPASGVPFAGNISWLDTSYSRYIAVGPAGMTRNAAGNRLNNAPESNEAPTPRAISPTVECLARSSRVAGLRRLR